MKKFTTTLMMVLLATSSISYAASDMSTQSKCGNEKKEMKSGKCNSDKKGMMSNKCGGDKKAIPSIKCGAGKCGGK